MKINPYLSFNGQCEAAFKFYEKCFGGRIVAKITFGEMPMAEQCAPMQREKIAHIRLVIGDQVLMGSDTPPEHYEAPKGTQVTLNIEAPEEADRVFNALADGATITMPIQKTFWAKRFGMLVDRFGTPWMINCEEAQR
ncbi:MAG TPA: glyoxalase/bleomycin resistance/extradiol dioxygenase family protein [Stellaceae bacterium]|nr:glyoxalase/bleomycin resistance/extradiol dioxygenase family protein [Stellaceae bacterium]